MSKKNKNLNFSLLELGNFFPLIESNLYNTINKTRVGDIISLGYLIPEGNKERIQYYEGLIIACNNRGLGKTIHLRRILDGIGIEQIFFNNSPKIVSFFIKSTARIKRAKFYFIRSLSLKKLKLKSIRPTGFEPVVLL